MKPTTWFAAALSGVFLLVPQTGQAKDLSAKEIMQKVNDRDDGDNGVSDMKMVLIDKSGHRRERNMRRYSKDKGLDRLTLMFFQSPADVRNTGFLTFDYDDNSRDDDQWLYLPALNKSKRIAASDKSGSFMGSDFNYSDMTRKDLDRYTFKILKEDVVRGDPVWLIEAVPTTQEEIEESGYSKSVAFIRKDNFVLVRAVHWVEGGKRLKYLDVKGLQQIDGIWTATQTDMTTKQGKATVHKTELHFSNVRFNQKLDSNQFTLRSLEKGL